MRFFKSLSGEIFAYDAHLFDEGSDFVVDREMTEITEEEALNISNPPKTNQDLLQEELQTISKKYQEDIDALNQAYLAAVVSDGPGEPAKQQAVRDAITARKAQYAADKEAARLKYPV